MAYGTTSRYVRVNGRWIDRVEHIHLSFEARWHYLCLVNHCTERRLYDGVIDGIALKLSDIPDPPTVMDELMAVGLIDKHDDGRYRLLNLADHWPASWLRGSLGPTLYQLYSEDLQLLYVGITDNVYRRLSEHEATQEWWSQVHGVRLEKFNQSGLINRAERQAIRNEHPLYNVAYRACRGCSCVQYNSRLTDDLCTTCRPLTVRPGSANSR